MLMCENIFIQTVQIFIFIKKKQCFFFMKLKINHLLKTEHVPGCSGPTRFVSVLLVLLQIILIGLILIIKGFYIKALNRDTEPRAQDLKAHFEENI